MIIDEIDLLSEEGAKEVLRKIMEQLDELDEDDFFGTQGWRKRFRMED